MASKQVPDPSGKSEVGDNYSPDTDVEGELFQGNEMEERNIVIIGASGSGKSALVNTLKSYGREESAESKASASSVTTKAVEKKGQWRMKHGDKEYSIKYYDTRGLSDSSVDFDSLKNEWDTAVKEFLNEIHYLIVVIPVDRLSLSTLTEIKKIMALFVGWKCKQENVLMVLNKVDFLSEDTVNGFTQSLKDLKLNKLIQDAEVMRMCCPKLNEIEETMRTHYRRKMVSLTNKIVTRLLKPVEPFKPKLIVLEEEEKRLMKEREAALRKADDLKNKSSCLMM